MFYPPLPRSQAAPVPSLPAGGTFPRRCLGGWCRAAPRCDSDLARPRAFLGVALRPAPKVAISDRAAPMTARSGTAVVLRTVVLVVSAGSATVIFYPPERCYGVGLRPKCGLRGRAPPYGAARPRCAQRCRVAPPRIAAVPAAGWRARPAQRSVGAAGGGAERSGGWRRSGSCLQVGRRAATGGEMLRTEERPRGVAAAAEEIEAGRSAPQRREVGSKS